MTALSPKFIAKLTQNLHRRDVEAQIEARYSAKKEYLLQQLETLESAKAVDLMKAGRSEDERVRICKKEAEKLLLKNYLLLLDCLIAANEFNILMQLYPS